MMKGRVKPPSKATDPKTPRKKAPRKKKPVDDEAPLNKRYPTFCDPAENSADEERFVRQKLSFITGVAAKMNDNVDDLDFDLLDDAAPNVAATTQKEPDEYMTGFVCFQVYRCLYGQPISALPPPREAIDTPEMCRDKRFAVDAAKHAKHYIDHELAPHADRLYSHLTDALAWNKEVTRFHTLLRRKFGYQRSFLTTLPQVRADLLLMAHVVYCLDHYISDAVNAVMDTLSDRERQAMSLTGVWEFLCGGKASQSVLLWNEVDSTVFVKRVCFLRDVVHATQAWEF
jgi:hypothetical protein